MSVSVDAQRKRHPVLAQTEEKTGRLLVRLGSAGVAAVVVATIVAWMLVDGVVSSIGDSLTLTDDAIVAVGETIDVAERALAATSGGLEAVEEAVGDVERALATTSSVLGEADTVLGTTVPAGIDAIRAPLPGLIESSEVLSGVLNGLSILGVDFRPDPPPAESLRSIDAELGDLADQLRDPVAGLGRIGDEFDVLNENLETIAVRLADLSDAVDRGKAVLAGYTITTDDAAQLVAAAGDDLDDRRVLARLLIVVVGAMAVGVNVGLIATGRHLRRSSTLDGDLPALGSRDRWSG